MTREKKKIVNIAIWIVAGICLCTILVKTGLAPERILMILAICMGSVLIHYKRASGSEDYIKKILGLKAGANRDFRYDWLRVLAVVMVIVTHAVQVDLSLGLVTDKHQIFICNIVYMLCLACNLIYVMLSGALLIPYKEEKLSDFYIKRVVKVFFPMVVYFIFYLWQNRELDMVTWGTIRNICVRLLQGDTPESPHYWLMYTLLSVYIVIPLFRYMFRNMPYKMLSAIVVISLVLMGLNLFSPVKIALSSFLAGWEGIAIIGYWVTRPETKKYHRLLIGTGIAAFAVMIFMITKEMDYRTLCCNTSPIMTLISAGIFAFVLGRDKVFGRGNVLLNILSKYSYSLILIHWWSLHWITRGRLGIQVTQYHGGGLVLSLLVTLFVSLLAAVCIDNFVMVFMEQIFWWMLEGVKKLIGKTALTVKRNYKMKK